MRSGQVSVRLTADKESMDIRTLLRAKDKRIETIQPDAVVGDAVTALSERNIGLLVVCGEDKRIQGVFSERDLVHGLRNRGPDVLSEPVHTLMTKDVQTCGFDDRLEDVMQRMARERFRHIPVIDPAGNLHCLLSSGDILNHLNAHASSDERVLFWSKMVWV